VSEYRIAKKGRACAVCAREFRVGEDFVSAIFPLPEGSEEGSFERKDACPGCLAGIGREPFSRWVTRLPAEKDRSPVLDLSLAQDFLVRLVHEGSPERRSLMHILALLLLRKRKVKLIAQRHEGELPVLDLIVRTAEGEVPISVPAVMPADEERAGLESELGRLFGLSAGPVERG
jgi:hypothetical protein